MPINPKTKGAAYERELAHHFEDALGIRVWRTAVSVKFGNVRQGNHDLEGLPLLSVEAKRVEALNFHAAYAQAVRNAAADTIPAVIQRRSRVPTGKSLVVVCLDDFMRLYRALLTQQGIRTEIPNV